jgi:hypothetical protein
MGEERIDEIKSGTTFLPPEAEAIGFIYGEILRPITLEPLPWLIVDALRAVHRAERDRRPPNAF